MDKVVHFEIPVDNAERAKKFYKETFSWDIKDMPDLDYMFATTSETDDNGMIKNPGSINGGFVKKGNAKNIISAPSFSIYVLDIDEAIKKIKNAGGLILKDKTEIGDMGILAYFKDTEGNILSIWQDKKKEHPQS